MLGVVASLLIVVCKWMKQLSTNNVGSCCVLVDSGVQTDATTPNNVGPSQVLVRHAKLLLCCLQGDYVLAHHRCWSVTRSYCFAVSKETMCWPITGVGPSREVIALLSPRRLCAGPSQVLVRHAKLLLCCLQGDYVLAHHRCWSVTRSYCFAVSKETMCNARSWRPQQFWESCATL